MVTHRVRPQRGPHQAPSRRRQCRRHDAPPGRRELSRDLGTAHARRWGDRFETSRDLPPRAALPPSRRGGHFVPGSGGGARPRGAGRERRCRLRRFLPERRHPSAETFPQPRFVLRAKKTPTIDKGRGEPRPPPHNRRYGNAETVHAPGRGPASRDSAPGASSGTAAILPAGSLRMRRAWPAPWRFGPASISSWHRPSASTAGHVTRRPGGALAPHWSAGAREPRLPLLIGVWSPGGGADWLLVAGAGPEGGRARPIMAGAGALPLLLLLLAASGAAGTGGRRGPVRGNGVL